VEQTPIQKKPVAPLSKDILDDVVSALLADKDLRPKKSRLRTSRRYSRKLKGSEKPTKPQPAERDELEERIVALFDDCATNADQRLREFIRGERCLVEKDDNEHYYNSEEGRNYTLEEVGNVMGVTRERVRQIEEHALRKMWRLIRGLNMRDDLTQEDWLNGIRDNKGDDEPTIYYPETV